MRQNNLINKWNILIASLLGLFALTVILAEIHFTLPGTSILTDPREIFVLLSAALTGPVGASLTAILAAIYDPTSSLNIYIICQHVFGAAVVSIIYKKYVFEKFVMPFFMSAWIALVLIYYYVLYIPGYFLTYFIFPDIYNTITSNDPYPIAALFKIYNGWTFEIVFTVIVTILFLIALPHRFRNPFWGERNEPQIGHAQKRITNLIYEKLFSHNYLGFRLGIWYLLLSLIPFFVFQAFIHNDINKQFVKFALEKHETLSREKLNEIYSSDLKHYQDQLHTYRNGKFFLLSLDGSDIDPKTLPKVFEYITESSSEINSRILTNLELIITKININEKSTPVVFYTSLTQIDNLLMSLESKASRNLGISLIMIVLLAGITIWLIIVRPIKRLTLALRDVGDGNYQVKIPIRAMDDELGEMAGSFNDMTQKIKRAYEQVEEEVENRLITEATLIKSEENLKHITDNILDVVLETDNRFLIKYASPSTIKMFKKEHHDFIGRNFVDVVQERSIENVRTVLENLKESRKPVLFEFEMRTEEVSSKVFLESICNPLIEEGGNLTGFIFTLRDITERKEFEKNLKKAKKKAEKSDKLKSEFLAQMSHEIRTPINSILNFTQLIKSEVEEHLSEDLKDSFTIINTSSNRLIRTIDSILNLSQLQQGSYDINPTRFNLAENIQRVIDEFKGIAAQKKLNLQFESPGEDYYIYSDAYMVSQIAANLIDNAIKYTEAGRISVKINSTDEGTELLVKDTGI